MEVKSFCSCLLYLCRLKSAKPKILSVLRRQHSVAIIETLNPILQFIKTELQNLVLWSWRTPKRVLQFGFVT